MCRCETCFGKYSHQKSNIPFDGGNLYPDVTVTSIGKVSQHYVNLTWSDGHNGLIARTIRGDYGPEPVPSIIDKYLALSMRENESQKFWVSKSAENYKFFDYSCVISNIDNIREFIAHYMVHGIAFMNGIPGGRDLNDIINQDLKCGPLYETVFGGVDKVRLQPNPINSGYGNGRLAGHNDINYYYQSPHVEFFHCLENTVLGGESFWVDSFAAIKEVSEERRDYFDILTKTPIYHRFTPPGTDRYVRSHHTLVTTLGRDIMRINDNPWSMDTSMATRSLDLETRKLWWEAYLYFRAKVEDPNRWIMRKLKGGEVVMLDNWRVYHGRQEFMKNTEGQERTVATAYVNWNHVQRVLLSPVEAEPCFLEIDKH